MAEFGIFRGWLMKMDEINSNDEGKGFVSFCQHLLPHKIGEEFVGELLEIRHE
jgi:hypothetical protein